MTQTEIYRYINALWNADSLGGTLNLKEYNDAQKEVNTTMFLDAVEELFAHEKAGNLNYEAVFSSKMLRQFIAPYLSAPVIGMVTLSPLTGFAFFLKMHTTASYHGQIRDIKLVDHNDFVSRQTNLMRPPIKYNPICTIDNQAAIKILPTDITAATIYYLKYPATPIFDYYVDTNDVVQPLAAAATHTLTSGETGSAGQTSGTTVTSTTVELEWPVEFHFRYMNMLIKRLGLANENQLKLQSTMIEEQKIESK
jgi:hypothetical protein